MSREKPTVSSLSKHLRDELSDIYPAKELNAIIKIVLSHLSGKDRTFLLANPGYILSSNNWFKVNKICNDLKKRMPVQYITGETEFYGLTFKVTGGTLIPRQETEELADLIIRENKDKEPSIIDIGTGSGCLAVSLAKNIPGASITATDISRHALRIAKENAVLNKVSLHLIHDDILDPVLHKYAKYDLAVSNPPYVTISEKKDIDINIIEYEPPGALFVPDDNAMKYYVAVLDFCESRLRERGRVYFEINESKGREIKELLGRYRYKNISVNKDINGRDRIAKGIKG